MEFLSPWAAAGFLVVPAILALYILKVRRPESPVASFVLWPSHLADRQANAPWRRLRPSWLLIIQLLVAAALAAALMRPGLVGAGSVDKTTVVLIDGSPSMLATDVKPSRFAAAVQRAGQLADRLGEGSQMAIVLLGQHAQLLANATSDTASLRAALARARPSGQAANLEEGISVANAVLAGRPQGSVVLYSDGHTRPPASPLRLFAPLSYESIGTASANVAIETVGRTEAGEIFVRIANLGSQPVERRIELRSDGQLTDVLPVRIAPNSTAEPVWNGLPADAGILEARLAPGDDFALDDTAWLLTSPVTPRRLLLVTEGNGFLARALEIQPNVDVEVVAPADYQPGTHDLTIFDGFVPDGTLPQPALVVAPPLGKGAVPAGPPIDPGGLLPATPREPLLQYVTLRDVHVRSASSVEVPAGWRTVIAGANGPLLVVRQGEPRMAQLNFDIHDSDLPLRAAFPVLVKNLLSYLLPGGFDNQVLALGQPVSTSAGAGAEFVEVTTPDDSVIRLRPPFPATFEDTSRPGVYSVRERRPGQVIANRFVVQLQDPGQSRIAPGERPVVLTASRPTADAPRGTLEIWPWLVALAIVGLLFEWAVFLRG